MSSPTATLTLMLFFLHLSRFGVTSSGKSGVENCGCPATCTPEVLNRRAGKYSCLDRMQYLHKYENIGREAACRRISGVEYPDICGPACHPDWCAEHWPTQTPTPVPTVMPTEKLDCGCPETCTEDVLSRSAGKYTCSDRMAYLWKFKKYTETEACQKIAIEDWPQACDLVPHASQPSLRRHCHQRFQRLHRCQRSNQHLFQECAAALHATFPLRKKPWLGTFLASRVWIGSRTLEAANSTARGRVFRLPIPSIPRLVV